MSSRKPSKSELIVFAVLMVALISICLGTIMGEIPTPAE